MQTFGYEDYGGYPQNWCLDFDPQGRLYVANAEALLRYDGSRWETLLEQGFQSLAIDTDGKVYVGGINDFGYFYDKNFYSLKYLLPDSIALDKVWRVHILPEGVFFYTDVHIFLLQNEDQVKVISPDTDNGFWLAYVANGKYFFQELGLGLFVWQEGEKHLIESDYCARYLLNEMLPTQDPDQIDLLMVNTKKGTFVATLDLGSQPRYNHAQ